MQLCDIFEIQDIVILFSCCVAIQVCGVRRENESVFPRTASTQRAIFIFQFEWPGKSGSRSNRLNTKN